MKRSRAWPIQHDLFGSPVYSGPTCPKEVPTMRELVLSSKVGYTPGASSDDVDIMLGRFSKMDIRDGRCSCGMPVFGMRCTDWWPFSTWELTNLSQLAEDVVQGGQAHTDHAPSPTLHSDVRPAVNIPSERETETVQAPTAEPSTAAPTAEPSTAAPTAALPG